MPHHRQPQGARRPSSSRSLEDITSPPEAIGKPSTHPGLGFMETTSGSSALLPESHDHGPVSPTENPEPSRNLNRYMGSLGQFTWTKRIQPVKDTYCYHLNTWNVGTSLRCMKSSIELRPPRTKRLFLAKIRNPSIAITVTQ